MAKLVSSPLPAHYYASVSGARTKTDESRTTTAAAFFEDRIPDCDRKEVREELKKTLSLEGQKGKKGRREGKLRVSKKFLTAKEKRDLGLYRLPKTGLKYEAFLGLHTLWVEYIEQLLDLKTLTSTNFTPGDYDDPRHQQLQMKICRSDFHGALFKVTNASCSTHVGVEGICLMETKFTLQIISKDNKIRIIPKRGTTFQFLVGPFTFSLPGSGVEARPAERATKKPKLRLPIDF